jgi:hypothetical protein
VERFRAVNREETGMNRSRVAATALLLGVMALAQTAPRAALIDRGHGLIYDTVLNVTWMQDVALARTLGVDSDGLFDWTGAKAWADQLVHAGFSDWRLPTLGPVSGVNWQRNFNCDGSADYGYGIAAPGGASSGFLGNELAYMFHVNLGNQSRCKGEVPNITWGPDVGWNASFVDALTNETVSFLNLQDSKRNFWADLPPAPSPAPYTWMFKYSGFNDWAATLQLERAWAVRDGDVIVATVPEPGAPVLLAGLLLALGLSTRARPGQRVAKS